MDVLTITLTGAAALAGGLTGAWQQNRLNTLTYRYPDETGQPAPEQRAWVPAALAAAVGLLTWRYLHAGQPDQLAHLIPVAIAGNWLTAVDLDVHRLPYRPTLAATITAGLGIGIVAILRADPWIAAIAAAAAALAYTLFWLLHRHTGGAIGRGDVRVAALTTLSAATLNPWTAWWAIALASIGSALWVAITRPTGRLPYGPWLFTGWLAASLLIPTTSPLP